MRVKCDQCAYTEESTAMNSIDILINAKLEHEWTHQDHTMAFIFGLRSKLITTHDVENVYKAHCKTCAELHFSHVLYSTISRLDLQRYIDSHSLAMRKKDIKKMGIEQTHEFGVTAYRYNSYLEYIENKNPVISRMKVEEITAADLSDATDVIKSTDDISQFLSASSSYEDIIICKRMIGGMCPISSCANRLGDYYPTIDWYNMFLQHMRKNHAVLTTTFDNKVVSILQQCLIFIRNIDSNYPTLPVADRIKKANKESEALRTLNKMGIPLNMLEAMFQRGVGRIGQYTYRGMKLLGFPDWVKEVLE